MNILDWKYTAIGVIFVVSTIGFLSSTFFNMKGENRNKGTMDNIKLYLGYLLRGFSAGVMLSVALMHLLVDALFSYSELCESDEPHMEAHEHNATEIATNSSRRFLEEIQEIHEEGHGGHHEHYPGEIK